MRDATGTPARRGPIEATVLVIIGVAVLCGLGVWQLHRKVWKENLIASLNAELAAPPEGLPPRASWAELEPPAYQYRRVAFPAHFLPGQAALVYTAGSAFRPDIKGPGYWVFAPARLEDGSLVVINRGFIPVGRKGLATRTPPDMINIVGVMRWPEKPGQFTPAADPEQNVWYLRDPEAMAAAKGWSDVAPFYVAQETPVPPGGWPKPGKLVVSLSDNHLQYALTWFGGAVVVTGLYAVWLVRRLRRA